MTDLLSGLNRAQREAVTSTEGYIRVIAGAGSGKTRALSRRYAFLVNELGILPENILCVTFTNRAANEMRRRIRALTGDNGTGYINTFHGFCVAVLQEDSHAVQYPKSFLVLDNSDIDAMLGQIYSERGLTLRDMTYTSARDMIEIRKLFKEPEYYRGMLDMPIETLREKYDAASSAGDIIFYGYLYQEKKCFGLDYNDLIKFTLHIFEQHEDIRLKWQQRLEYIMIDEFQDIDWLQYKLMEVLCAYHGNLFVVGDPDQTIYTWRGANVKYLLDFDKSFPDVRTVMMTENYRSTPEILAAANALIAKNAHRIPKTLTAVRGGGKSVPCFFAESQQDEAKWMAGEMKRLNSAGVPFGNIAVLCRAHYVTRAVEEALVSEQIPYALYCGVQFWDREEIKDALSYLRMLVYKDDLDFRRIANVPKRNLGKRRMAFLQEAAEKEGVSLYQALADNLDDPIFSGTGARRLVGLIEHFSAGYEGRPISEVLTELLDKSGYERALRTEGSQERLDNLAELKQSIYEYETGCGEECTLEHYLTHAALFGNMDTAQHGDRVRVMTVHAAKGLEFPYVFLCGMNEGIFPSRRVRTLQAMEEERRLAFVALTRAEDGLFISCADGRNLDGSARYPSRFVLDIGPAVLEYVNEPEKSLIAEAESYICRSERYMPEDDADTVFAEGQRVRHSIFGEGTVLSADRDKGAHLVQFDGMKTPRRISFRAKLERC